MNYSNVTKIHLLSCGWIPVDNGTIKEVMIETGNSYKFSALEFYSEQKKIVCQFSYVVAMKFE